MTRFLLEYNELEHVKNRIDDLKDEINDNQLEMDEFIAGQVLLSFRPMSPAIHREMQRLQSGVDTRREIDESLRRELDRNIEKEQAIREDLRQARWRQSAGWYRLKTGSPARKGYRAKSPARKRKTTNKKRKLSRAK